LLVVRLARRFRRASGASTAADAEHDGSPPRARDRERLVRSHATTRRAASGRRRQGDRDMRVIDLSVSVGPSMLVPPALRTNRLQFDTAINRSRQDDSMVRVGFMRNLCIHTGTHVDAPAHAITGRDEIAQVAVDRFVGPAAVVDLGVCEADTPIDAGRLAGAGDDLRPGDIAVLYSHWSERRWGQDEYWTRSPYLTIDGARWLVERGPRAIVFDFFEEYDARFPDFDASGFAVHREILGRGVLIVEHVVNLGALPRRGATFLAAPLKLEGLEGSPVRAIALVDR
jgi:kynurenine formamidase